MIPKKDKELTLKDYHKYSDRHILVVEADMSFQDKIKIFDDSEQLRLATNQLISEMNKRLDQLFRRKDYRQLLKEYQKYKNKDSDKAKKKRNKIGIKLTRIQEGENVTWDYCYHKMISISKMFKVHSQLTQTKAIDVWSGIKKILYDRGKVLHFHKFGKYLTLRATQINRCITLKIKNNTLIGKYNKIEFSFIEKDKFIQQELKAVKNYLLNSKEIDDKALEKYSKTKELTDTFRPCFITLVPEIIRGQYRVFAHICIEGKTLSKERKRKIADKGRIGIDIGTQTIAYTSNTEVGLKNLSERGMAIQTSEKRQKKYQRLMDSSRRANNPDNYNENGTIKKGRHTWIKSNRYKKYQKLFRELSRKNAINRKLACNEDAWHLRSLGNTVITEKMSWKGLQKRGKKKKNKDGKEQRRKRFGKSIQNRCPGYFQSKLKSVFESTGGEYIEVPYNYRASQYDHTEDVYIKKKLNNRMYKLRDGTKIQRDWYSSYLLYCFNVKKKRLNKKRCRLKFDDKLEMINNHIEYIKANGIKVLNSGIKLG